MTTVFARAALLAAAVAIIAGCSSSSSSNDTSENTTATTAPAATASGGPMTAAAPIPTDLKCSDAIVWVNTSKKDYHLSGDKWYGRTKHGQYMCQSDAEAKGYHLAGTAHNHTGSKMSGSTAEPSPSAT